MTTIIITFIIVLAAVFALSIGTFFNKKQISGTCSTTGDPCVCSPDEQKNDCPSRQI